MVKHVPLFLSQHQLARVWCQMQFRAMSARFIPQNFNWPENLPLVSMPKKIFLLQGMQIPQTF